MVKRKLSRGNHRLVCFHFSYESKYDKSLVCNVEKRKKDGWVQEIRTIRLTELVLQDNFPQSAATYEDKWMCKY